MSIRNEIDALMKDNSVLFEVAEKVEYRRDLNAEEKEIAEISDAVEKQNKQKHRRSRKKSKRKEK